MIGLILALLLTKSIRFLNMHRGIVFMPSVLSTLIIGMIFKSILDPKSGLLKYLLQIRRFGFACSEMAGILGACLRFGNGGGYLARCRIHHDDPDRGDPVHLFGLL